MFTCSTDESTHISASIAPEFVSGAAAKHPPRKRKIRKAGPFGATAQAICRIWAARKIKINKNKIKQLQVVKFRARTV